MIPGACDTHIHFYDGAYPVAPEAVLRPPDAGQAEYMRFRDQLELERLVVVQPTTYGMDNSCQLDAMARFDEHDVRGVMVVDSRTPASELAAMTERGVRGARFHMLPGGAVPWSELEATAETIAPYGWHIQLQLNGRELADRLDQLRRLPVALVIDHVGRFMPPVALDDDAFAALATLVDDGAMVKLSAPYESSVTGPPDYDDVTPLADALVARAPDRMLWASNWPHPGQQKPPSASDLDRLLRRWLPTAERRRQILVDNPQTLYDF